MGSIPLFRDPDEAGQIDAKDAGVGIMWIDQHDGDWIFRAEVRGFEHIEDVELLNHVWHRRVVCVRRRNGYIDKGDHVALTVHPYRADFCQTAPFKPPAKKGQMSRKPTRRLFSSEAEARAWIESLTYDYWETEDYLTAGLPLTRRESSWRERRPAHNHRLVFGGCPDPVAVRGDLQIHEHIAKLINLTDEGTIRVRPTGTDETGLLREDVRSRSDELMAQAIDYALSGPHKDSKNWFGKPVVMLVERVYKNLLHKHRRRKEL